MRYNDLEASGEISAVRQRDLFDPSTHEHASCVLIGCGGIGSPTAIALSKLGIGGLTLIDPDFVEPHNVPNQFYTLEDVGEYKVDALKEHCESFGASEIEVSATRFQEALDLLEGLVITGLDSMSGRKELWEKIKFQPGVERLIDGRIGRENIVLYTINPCDPDDIKYYEENALYSDEDAEDLACTERGIIYVSFEVAGRIARLAAKHFKAETPEMVQVFNMETLTGAQS